MPSAPTLDVVDDSDPLVGELADVPPAPAGLLEMLAQVPDPRQPRGVRHRLDGVLAVALAATLAGADSYTAIAEWVADAAPAELGALGMADAPPSESTIHRCLQRLAPDRFDTVIAGDGGVGRHLPGPWIPAPGDVLADLAAAVADGAACADGLASCGPTVSRRSLGPPREPRWAVGRRARGVDRN